MDRITNLQTRISHKKKRYFKNIVYPHVPIEFDDVYVITVVGDRLDNLAFTFYNDTSLWWVIAKANPDIISRDSFFITPGIRIRIPGQNNLQTIISNFENQNFI